jgi:hypothetical protein
MTTNNAINASYTSANTPNTLVERDSSGNFSAGTITATVTTATNANNVATTQVTNNASYFPLIVSSSVNSNQALDLATGWTFNPSSNTLNTSNIQASSALQIGTTTNNAPLTVEVAGGATYTTALAAYFGSVVGGVAGNLYHITIAKGSYEAALLGINKNTTTGNNVPASYVYLSTYSSTGGIALGQGNNAGLPNNAALIVTNQVNIPNLTASQAVVTDGSQNLVSLPYTSANTVSTLVERDSSGNFSAGTITAALSGNASTATTATNATNIATLAAATSANFPLIFVASSTNSNQAPELNANLTYNPATGTLTISGNGGVSSFFNIGTGAASLLGTTKAFNFSSSLAAGNYINLGGSGRNLGVFSGGNAFYTNGLDYNVTGTNYLYSNSGTAAAVALELTAAGGFNFNTAPSGSNGAAATMTTRLSISNTGVVNVQNLTASSLVETDSSSNLISTNTLSNTVLGNVAKVTKTILTSATSGTYTTPANVTHIVVEVWGSGGGGAGCSSTASASGGGSGGGGGGYSRSTIQSPAATYSYTIDGGGAGGAAGANGGSAGGTTTFGTSLISITGGGGSLAGVASISLSAGNYANGGVASGADINIAGSCGSPSYILASGASGSGSAVSGAGGNSAVGGGGAPGRRTQGNGSNGSQPGGGGAGGCVINGGAAASGGNGGAAMIVVTEYYIG